MFGVKEQLIGLASEVEVGIAPTVEFTGTAQGLSGTQAVGLLFGMVNHQHGQLETALELTQAAEEGGDLGGFIFFDLVQSDQGIQDQQSRFEGLERQDQTLAIPSPIQAERGGGDNLQG